MYPCSIEFIFDFRESQAISRDHQRLRLDEYMIHSAVVNDDFYTYIMIQNVREEEQMRERERKKEREREEPKQIWFIQSRRNGAKI